MYRFAFSSLLARYRQCTQDNTPHRNQYTLNDILSSMVNEEFKEQICEESNDLAVEELEEYILVQ